MSSTVQIILDAVNKASDDFKQVSKDASKMGDSIEKANKKSKRSGADLIKSLKGAAVAAGAVTAGFIAVGVAAKKAFEFGKEGAAVRQTTESFDMLLEKVGAAPDLLDRLGEAANGTVDDMTLMSSTLTLVAGASDKMAGAMLDAAPKLLEIAKAANKLNPALGSTAKMYSDIMTGVKRAQPLILDNLGLTLKVGDANKEYADTLGKTVQQLTAEEKAMAILNATLEAGNIMIDQVGGNTDSATDSFAQFEVSIKNAGDAMKAGFSDGASNVVAELTRVADEFTSTQEIYAEYEAAVKAGIITTEQMGVAFANVANKGLTSEEAINRLNAGMRFWADSIPPVNISLGILGDKMEEVAEVAADFSAELMTLKSTMDTTLSRAADKFGDSFGAAADQAQKDLQRILLSMIEVELAADGIISEEDVAFITRLAEEWGLVDEAAVTAMQGVANIANTAATNIDKATAAAKRLSNELLNIPSYISVVVDIQEKHGKGYYYPGDPPGPGGQHGLDMTVPPGYPGDTYPIRATSGEHVTVTPAGEKPAGGETVTINNDFTIVTDDPHAVAIEVANLLAQQSRMATVSGAQYAGN